MTFRGPGVSAAIAAALDANAAHIAAVAQTAGAGAVGKPADSGHAHQGVTSAAGGSTVVVSGGDGSGHGAVSLAVSTAVAVIQEDANIVAASGAAQTIPDVTTATMNIIVLTANCTLTFPPVAAGKSFLLALKQDATGSRTVTWPGTIFWAGGTAPTLTTTANKLDLISVMSLDGTEWIGVVAGQSF
jgi:hypothetical protein